MKKTLTLALIISCITIMAGCNAAPPANESGGSTPPPSSQATDSGSTDAGVASPGTDSSTTPNSTSDNIGEDEAKRIALEHAAVAEADTQLMHVKLDFDDGRSKYDVEFYAGDMEYDYEIDAVNGTILEYDVESKFD